MEYLRLQSEIKENDKSVYQNCHVMFGNNRAHFTALLLTSSCPQLCGGVIKPVMTDSLLCC